MPSPPADRGSQLIKGSRQLLGEPDVCVLPLGARSFKKPIVLSLSSAHASARTKIET